MLQIRMGQDRDRRSRLLEMAKACCCAMVTASRRFPCEDFHLHYPSVAPCSLEALRWMEDRNQLDVMLVVDHLKMML